MPEQVDFESIREEYEKQIYDLRQLLEVSKSLNSTLDYSILIDSILLTTMGQMKVLKAALFAKKGIDSIHFSLQRNYKGFDIDHGVDYSISEEHPVIKLFTRQYGCYSLEEIRARTGSYRGIECLGSLAPSLIVPLKAKGVINGILVLGDRIGEEGYDVPEREYVINLAAFAAIAINNAFLFEMTTTDMMTRLKMKHYFHTVLIERIEKASLSGKPLSVAMIDIDRFKRFNDAFGHSCGDAVLRHAARLILEGIRGSDLAARYGGEEFCVLLQDADRAQALVIAERIRASVAGAPTSYEGRLHAVTISLGVAQYDPARDISGKSLIDRADKALYLSKQNGRDRTTVAD
jgi:two-component system cell cycle response regulator